MPPRSTGRARGGPSQARGLTRPSPGAALVPRPRLGALLDGATTEGLTLLAAAPGSGKTVALREWAARTRADLAWVALAPRGDGDADALWRRLAAALAGGGRGVAHGGEAEVLHALDARRSPLLVVVDDAHEANDAAFAAFAERLIDHPSARLIVSTRVDPRQPLHRLRVEGRLHEIRGADLAFTADEARAMLARQGVELTEDELALLVRRTEGWAAGLRLAALLLVGHERPGEAVREFAGDDRAVVAFLVHEVLDRQPPEVREMLVRTSVLRRVSGPLADALTEAFGGQTMLEDLVRRHALVEPLDRHGRWYRYHPLFADLLRSQLRRRGPDAIAEQDRRAARFLRDDEPAEALRHAARAGAWELVDALLRDHGLLLRATAGAGGAAGSAVEDALRDVPAAVLSRHPFMALFAAAQALGEGRDATARALLVEAEAHATAPAGERRGRLGVGLALARALFALRAGDVAGVRHHAAVVLHGPVAQDRTAVATRAVALLALGEALVADGDPDAERRLREAALEAGRAGLAGLARRAEALRAWCYALDGHVRQAALAVADLSAGDRGAVAGADSRIPEAELARAVVAGERGDMVAAGVAVRRAAAALALTPGGGGRLPSLALETVRGRLAMAAATPAERQAALGGLTRASAGWATPAPRRLSRLSLALRAALLVDLDRAVEARALLDDVGAGHGALIQIARAEAELALGDTEIARALAEAVADRSGLSLPLAVTASSAAARAAEAAGDRPAALRLIGRALDLAEADGLRLALAAAGCAPLLAGVLRTGTSHRALVGDVLELTATGTAQPVGAPVAPLREPLTERELAVLRFLPTMLSSQEIAGELFVTLNTVKSHLRNLYRKLGVNGRREAIDRGRALGLLAPGTLGARPT